MKDSYLGKCEIFHGLLLAIIASRSTYALRAQNWNTDFLRRSKLANTLMPITWRHLVTFVFINFRIFCLFFTISSREQIYSRLTPLSRSKYLINHENYGLCKSSFLYNFEIKFHFKFAIIQFFLSIFVLIINFERKIK